MFKEIIKYENLIIKKSVMYEKYENFIKNDRNEIFLIDWEYSGMNDPMWDLSAHFLESGFSKKEEIIFLENYFNKNIKKEDFLRIECYKVLQDFLWSIWTILKEENGDNFWSLWCRKI